MKYLIISLFVITYIFFGNEIGYSNSSPFWTHFTFMFQHVNIIHLVLNSISFFVFFDLLSRFKNKYMLLFECIAISFVASFITSNQLPTVGASAMVYAMIGIFIALITQKKIKFNRKKNMAIFLLAISISLIFSYFKPNSNFSIHAVSILIGFVGEAISKSIKKARAYLSVRPK